MKKRLLSVLLSVVLVFGSVNTTAFAKEVVETETQTPESVPEGTVAETKSDPEITIEEDTEQRFENNSEEEETDEELLAENSGTCGDNLTWSFDESTGTLTITGSGDMNNYAGDVPWLSYKNEIIELELRHKR